MKFCPDGQTESDTYICHEEPIRIRTLRIQNSLCLALGNLSLCLMRWTYGPTLLPWSYHLHTSNRCLEIIVLPKQRLDVWRWKLHGNNVGPSVHCSFHRQEMAR